MSNASPIARPHQRSYAPAPSQGWFAEISDLFSWLVITAAAAAVGAWGSMHAPTFYGQLNLPSWAPPSGLFGPAWSVLYLLMAVAATLVWRERQRVNTTPALLTYGLHLVANLIWSWLFFTFHLGALALADALLMLGLLLVAAWRFWKVRPLAGALLLPAVAWVSFAVVLNAVIWRMNPALLG